jgi:hypothetical protein
MPLTQQIGLQQRGKTYRQYADAKAFGVNG